MQMDERCKAKWVEYTVRGKRTEGRGQRTEDRDQKSGEKEGMLEWCNVEGGKAISDCGLREKQRI